MTVRCSRKTTTEADPTTNVQLLNPARNQLLNANQYLLLNADQYLLLNDQKNGLNHPRELLHQRKNRVLFRARADRTDQTAR